MPSYRTHIFGGLIISIATGATLVAGGLLPQEWPLLILLGGICILGSLFPDIDTSSKGQSIFYLAFLVLDGWLLATQRFELAAWLGFLAVIPVVGQHRGWVHTWWAMLLLPLPIVLVPWLVFKQPWHSFSMYYSAFVLGYFSHLLLDRQFR